jgi:hypothetical protein
MTPTRIADPKEKQERLLTELAIKRTEAEAAAKAYNDKKAELDALLQPLLDAKTAATEAVTTFEDKIRSDCAGYDKADLITGISKIERKTWEYSPVEVLRWAIIFYPSILSLDKTALKHELNDAADNTKKTKQLFEVLGIPAELTKVPEVQISSDVTQYLPPVEAVKPEAVDGGEPILSKTPAEIAEQINSEDDNVPSVFNRSPGESSQE